MLYTNYALTADFRPTMVLLLYVDFGLIGALVLAHLPRPSTPRLTVDHFLEHQGAQHDSGDKTSPVKPGFEHNIVHLRTVDRSRLTVW